MVTVTVTVFSGSIMDWNQLYLLQEYQVCESHQVVITNMDIQFSI